MRSIERNARVAEDWRRVPWLLRYATGARIATKFRKALILATHQHCVVRFEGPVHLGPGFTLRIPSAGTLIIGPFCEFRDGFVCEIADDGVVNIGAGTRFTASALIQITTSLTIGERCAFGQSVLIVDGAHRYLDPDVHWMEQGYDFAPITIGDGAFVSDKCTVRSDIGERAVIASHSVVNRPIPPYSVAAGVPARVVRTFR